MRVDDETRVASWPAVGSPARRVALLDVDPYLGEALRPHEFERARQSLTVPTETFSEGPWRPPSHPNALGFLVVSGLVIRDLRLGGCARFAELLGSGDLLRPWQEEKGTGILPWTSSWHMLEQTTVAAIGTRLLRRAAEWPEIVDGLFARSMDRTRRQSIAASIPNLMRTQDRLVVLFLHLAERWGQVTPDGIVLRLPLTHDLVARLAGTRRPTVTTALSALAQRELITRAAPSEWLLAPAIHDELDMICAGRVVLLGERGSRVN